MLLCLLPYEASDLISPVENQNTHTHLKDSRMFIVLRLIILFSDTFRKLRNNKIHFNQSDAKHTLAAKQKLKRQKTKNTETKT